MVYLAHLILETQALLLLNWQGWFWGTSSPRSQPRFSEWAPYLPNPHLLTHVNTQKCWSQYHTGCCWLCDRAGVLWEMCHPSYRGQLLHSHHPHAGSFARQHVHGIRLRGCFSLASHGAVWEPAHSHHPVLWQHARERWSLRSHRWAALTCAALTPLVQTNTFYSLWHKVRTPR